MVTSLAVRVVIGKERIDFESREKSGTRDNINKDAELVLNTYSHSTLEAH